MIPARIAAVALLAAALLASPALADEAAAVQAAIRENYAAYSGFDEARYRSTTTDDFLLLEHGELIDREGDVANMAQPGTGFRRTDRFDFDTVTTHGDVAWAVYTLKSEIHDDTRVSHPAGAADMKQFAVRYSAAWSSQDPARVAAFHADNGSLTINGGTPSVGRTGITEAVRAFMSAYPDMVVELDSLEYANGKYRYHWRFTGTNSGPGGTGRPVKIGGFEEWTMGADGLIAASLGHYDAADWDRQVGGKP